MRFFVISLLIITIIISNSFAGSGKIETKNKFVACDIVLKQQELKIAENGEILISLTPKKGIHINLTPPMSIKIEKSKYFTTVGNLDIPKDENTSYMDISRPIKQIIKLDKKPQKGFVAIKGSLDYYYCSDAEGWCCKFTQPIDLKVKVAK
jgi:hypothetical protein